MDHAETKDTFDLQQLATAFEELGRRISPAGGDALQAVVDVAHERIPGAIAVSITRLHHNEFVTAAHSGPLAEQADRIQYEVGSGPCIDAILDEAIYAPRDIRNEQRWPEFGRRVHDELGVGSMLAFRLGLDSQDVISALNIYGKKEHAFTERDQMVGLLLATHGAMVINAATAQRDVANLQRALLSNREIGMALGVLMHRHKLTQDDAFHLLAVASQRTNQKLVNVARRVVETGELTALDAPRNANGNESLRG